MNAIDLDSLNINQKKAVLWDDGPLLVLAGPGSGKTRVLTYRIARLLNQTKSEKFKILGLTFTNKAAAEMRERVEQLIPSEIHRVMLTTFHSFCGEILRQHGSHIGLKPNFTIISEDEDKENILLDAIRKSKNMGYEETDKKFIKTIDILLSKFVGINDVVNHFNNDEQGEKVKELYSLYKKELVTNNCVDFNTLLYYTHQLFSEKSVIKKQMQIVYKYICVDEFQDTNFAQYTILTHLINPISKNIFVVADDDQIIYQWNGANPERLYSLKKDYEMNVVQLPENYRCPPSIVNIANNLIQYNTLRSTDKEPLIANKIQSNTDDVRTFSFNSMDDEFLWVANDIMEKYTKNLEECVVLARNKSLLDKISNVLKANGIQPYLSIKKNQFESSPLIWIHNLLYLFNSRKEKVYLRKLCKAFYLLEGINLSVIDIIEKAALFRDDYLITFLELALSSDNLSDVSINYLKQLRNSIIHNIFNFSSILSSFKWCDTLEENKKDMEIISDYKEEKIIWDNIIKNIISQYGKENISIHLLLQELELSPKTLPVPPNSVRCYTIHNSKGLEFNNVYLIGLAEDILPSFQSKKKGDDSLEMQEERRNCFVAITRTQSTLTLTYSLNYFGWKKTPSRFLYEMGVLEQ